MKKILIVDDEEIMRFALVSKLKEHGFAMTEACNGLEAIDISGKQSFDAVLLDLKMPGIDGIETMRGLKKIDANIPVIIVTAYGDIPTAVEAIKIGAYDFVEKPPQISKIVVTLRRAIEKAGLEKEIEKLGLVVEASKTLQDAYDKLKEIDRMKTDFISNVSHELLTPLTSIFGFMKVIDKKLEENVFPLAATGGPKTEKAIRQIRENINIVVLESRRLSSLIHNVLDISRMESGEVKWKKEQVVMSDVITQAINETSALFKSRGLRLVTEIGDPLPEITGDSERLTQVLVNLLGNAVKFTEKGEVTVKADRINSCPGSAEHADFIQVSVTDTGIGIAKEDQSKVFVKFGQIGNTLTDKPGGAGLGLLMCKEIVDHHGGKIWMESETGKGSTFSFALPVDGDKQ